MMLKFVKTAFSKFFGIILWVNLVLWAISGIVLGSAAGQSNPFTGDSSGGHPILGFIGGAVIGIFLNIVGGGLIATLLNIDANIEKIAANNVKKDAGILNAG